MVKPILIFAGAIPIILAILIAVPLITSPEIPITAIDPDDDVQIEFTKHELMKVSFGVTERFGAEQTEIISIENDNSMIYSLVQNGIVMPEKKSSIDNASKMKLIAMIKETGFMSIPSNSFIVRDDINKFVKFGVKITYNGEVSQLYWPEQDATDQFIPPMMIKVQEELEIIMNDLRE